MFAKRAISWIQNHPVMPSCAERGRQHHLISPPATGNRAVHAGKQLEHQSMWKSQYFSERNEKMRGKGVFVKQDRGSAGEQHEQDSSINSFSVYIFATISAFTVRPFLKYGIGLTLEG